MELERIQEIIRVFEASGLSELEIEENGSRIRLKKPEPGGAPMPVRPDAAPPRTLPDMRPEHSGAAPHAPVVSGEIVDDDLLTIDAPMVGVFYAAPAPGEAPFVKPGDRVAENQMVCIVEAMKLMNEVAAKFPAEIVKVLVENGEPVEFGQPLFAVRRLG